MADVYYEFGKLIDSFTIIVPDDQLVSAEFKINSDKENVHEIEKLHATIIFEPFLNPETNKSDVKWESKDGSINFVFYGWNSSSGSTTSQIINKIGTTDSGDQFFLLLTHFKVGDAHQLTMQLITSNNVRN
jgi:hypothetical protein